LRDAAYSAIARRRYRLFGRRETCFMPTSLQSHRFIQDRSADSDLPCT
jgi:predicted DCC family thiol-disulfide oxidoreductase YuxK